MKQQIALDNLRQALIKHLFWGKTLDYNTSAFETPESLAAVEIAINIAKQQLPARCAHNENAIYQRCVELFRMGGFYWYKHWC